MNIPQAVLEHRLGAREQKDMDTNRAEIHARLEEQGLSFVALDHRYGLSYGIAWKTCTYPHKAGERVISRVLGIAPETIWPSRYDEGGRRLRPQPRDNYIRHFLSVKRSARRAS